MTKLTLKEKEKYFKNQNKVGKVIISHVKKKGLILFGQKAVNRQLPKDLRKDTEDYDVFSDTPKVSAKRIERKLDRKLKGNYFYVKPAIHGGTHKVMSQIGDKGIVDVGKPEKEVPTIKKKGIRLATLNFQKAQIKKSLKDKKSFWRHAKDREVRTRIKIAEQRKKMKPVKRKQKYHVKDFNLKTKVNF